MKNINHNIHVRKLPDGWQAFKVENGKVLVLDDFFEHEDEVASLV